MNPNLPPPYTFFIIDDNTFVEFRDCNFKSTVYQTAKKDENLKPHADVEDIGFWCNAGHLLNPTKTKYIKYGGSSDYTSVLSLKNCNISEFRYGIVAG